MDEAAAERVRRRRWPRALVAVLIALAVLALVLWIERRPIATRFVDRDLARRGVPARYTIETVGLRRQRLTDVVIGDPRAPDLVADWIEVDTAVGLGGAEVTGVRTGQVRLRGRIVDGRLSLGALDRLTGPPSGAPFALPKLFANLGDVRLRIETPLGAVGAKLSGRGRLDDGFRGQLAIFAERLEQSGCRASAARAAVRVAIDDGAPTLRGPVAAGTIACAGDTPLIRGPGGEVAVTLSPALDRWRGRAERFGASVVSVPGFGVAQPTGTISFEGDARRTVGSVDLRSAAVRLPDARAREAAISGRYELGGVTGFRGRVAAEGVAAGPALTAQLAGLRGSGARTPVGPIVDRLASALAAAMRASDAEADVAVSLRGDGGDARVTSLRVAARSGARAVLAGEGLRYTWPDGALAASGVATLGGGGLPDLRVAFGLTPDGAVTGTATVAPMLGEGARLALAPATFRFSRAGGRLVTRAELTGPLADGRVDGLTLPIDARWGAALTLNPACTPVSWRRLTVSSLTLAPARLTACPVGGALATLANGRLGGGMQVARPRLTGRIGSTPLSLSAGSARIGLADLGFAIDGLAARLGAPERVTRIDAASLNGRVVDGGARGRFAGGGGQIGAVPLLLSDAAGDWSFARGRLALTGGLSVADAAEADRFNPLRSDDVALTLAGNLIEATATLRHPTKGREVVDVRITHDLARGVGTAALDVANLAFGPEFQPNEVTPLTFGVIAAVTGSVSGRGEIAWTPEGVTSSGRFRTTGTDLAAAFGPVTGLSGEIVFTDLLGLVSAPDQVATIASVNPGIAVENGTVRYRLVGDNRVQVDGARWPFAGGELVLEPTLLDFNADQQRRMTFRVVGADAAAFLQQFDFDNISATGTFDGVLPMIFDQSGGRIEGGVLTARGGGSIAYVGAVSQENLGTWGNFAFDALKALNYRNLDITLNGPLAGEMITQLRFAGVSQGAGTKSNFIIRRLARLPLVFNVTVRAPFRQLIDSARSFYDPKRLIERNLPALLEEQRRRQAPPIQPPESEKRP